jgi:Reverse transcriptase (RNA-dependent DNA polymerase)
MRRMKIHALEQSAFYRLRSTHQLVHLLGVTNDHLQRLTHSEGLYREYEIAKNRQKKTKRRVEEPRGDLKRVQARIATLLGRIEPADYLYCPAKRRCYVTNAARHRHHRVVRCLDLKEFFPNTPRWRVYRFFLEMMECAGDVAGILASIASYKGHLPTGSPLSPIMAHYAYWDVWSGIAAIAADQGLTVTVYVDDVTLSGVRVPTSVVWQVKRVLHAAGLRYHKEKEFVDRPADVTGVISWDGKLLLPNRQHRKAFEAKSALGAARDEIARKATLGRLRGFVAQGIQIARIGRLA